MQRVKKFRSTHFWLPLFCQAQIFPFSLALIFHPKKTVTHLSPFSNDIHRPIRLSTLLKNVSIFYFPAGLLGIPPRSPPRSLTSYFPSGSYRKINPPRPFHCFASPFSCSLPRFLYLSLLPAHTRDPFSSLSATFYSSHAQQRATRSSLYSVHFQLRPHIISNISPFFSSPSAFHRSLPEQLYGTLIQPPLSKYLNKSNHLHPSLLLASTFPSFFIAFTISVPNPALVVTFSILYLHPSTHFTQNKVNLSLPVSAVSSRMTFDCSPSYLNQLNSLCPHRSPSLLEISF